VGLDRLRRLWKLGNYDGKHCREQIGSESLTQMSKGKLVSIIMKQRMAIGNTTDEGRELSAILAL
jgi:hypothetical protein